MTSKQLSPAQVHAVGTAAARNALDLMSDASTLLESGASRRAYALGVIAVEELAKSLRCRDILNKWPESITVTQLNKKLKPLTNAHQRRYAQALGYLAALNPGFAMHSGLADLEEWARTDMRPRERTLYVEVSASGAPMTPEGVAEAEATRWVTAVSGLFSTLGSAWLQSLDGDLAEAEGRASKTI